MVVTILSTYFFVSYKCTCKSDSPDLLLRTTSLKHKKQIRKFWKGKNISTLLYYRCINAKGEIKWPKERAPKHTQYGIFSSLRCWPYDWLLSFPFARPQLWGEPSTGEGMQQWAQPFYNNPGEDKLSLLVFIQ